MNHFMEIAKMRAARMLWAKLVKKFNPKNNKSLILRAHCQTSGWSLTEQDPYNNITRTCIEASAAVFGGTQSLHTNALDEAIGLPTDFSARIARNTQLFLQEETKVTKTVDPWAGSFYVEKLTHDIAEKAWELIEEVELLGGMTKAIEMGIPKLRIEAAAAAKQAKIDSHQDAIIGINKNRLIKETDIAFLEIDNEKVRKQQIDKLTEIKANRNTDKVIAILKKLTTSAQTGTGNLLEIAVEAARERATLGEISMALETVFGRYEAEIKTGSGVYKNAIKDDELFEKASQLAQTYLQRYQQKPKILIAKIGQDGHDRGSKVVGMGYTDIGFDVHISPLFQTAEEAVQLALENEVHILAISTLAAGHKTFVPEVVSLLKPYQNKGMILVVGGVIPAADYEFLYNAGVQAIFGPGTKISQSAIELLDFLLDTEMKPIESLALGV